MVEGSEALACVVAAIGAAHQILDDQADINQADSVVGRQVPLTGKEGNRHTHIQETTWFTWDSISCGR